MIWATVSSWSCFCRLHRASPSLVAKNIINLILVLTIWWCPCVESCVVLLEEGVCCDQCVLLAELCQPLACFILYSKAKLACYSRCFLTSYFCIPVAYDEKNIFFGVSSKSRAWVQLFLAVSKLFLLKYAHLLATTDPQTEDLMFKPKAIKWCHFLAQSGHQTKPTETLPKSLLI